MVSTALSTYDKANRAVKYLSPEQIVFADWLAKPPDERRPKTQQHLAEQLGVCEVTLTNWKRIPEIWQYRDSLIRDWGKGKLVPLAMKVLEEALICDNAKVRLDAARDVISRWSEPAKHETITATIKDLLSKNSEDETA